MVRTLALFLLTIAAGAAAAQGPAAEWRTIETAHFRLHYPREYEQWAMRAASRLESIRAEVVKEVGFAPPQRTDVLVMNPIAEPNGLAFPLLDTPRMVFYTEPPGPEEQIGAYGHWIDLLAVHETAHVVHMLRPSRNPLASLIERFALPLNPITLRAPRWVLEGYATVIEGRLTGAGRPTSTIRALILRRWAENGRIPTYGQLNSDRRFFGMSMAYLMGSAYLEWLEQRGGPDSLRNLWARLTARQQRSFDEAFIGVFGDRPDRLYGQFVAELTASAVAIRRGSDLREGTLFQETPRASGDPAVSPDGSRIAVVIRERDEPESLVIWSTGEPVEEEKKYQERLDKIFARDPEDVRPVRSAPLPRKAVHTLVLPDGGDIDTPRWMPDGKSILFAHRAPDAESFLHYDLYRWDFENVTRITRLADVRDADPHPNGRTAVAVRSRFGATQLVDVDLTTGAVTPRTEPSTDVVRSHPRFSPDGTRVAHIAHRNGTWTLFNGDDAIALSGDAASPEWLSNDELVVTLFTRGFAELHRVRGSDATAITRTSGGAFDAAPAPDGRIFFMSLDPDGYVLRLLDRADAAADRPSFEATFVPAIPPQPRTPVTFAAEEVTSRPYGIGRQEWTSLFATNLGAEHQATELGVRFGDVVGRLDTILIGSLGADDAPEGVALATTWRGWPVELHGHAFLSDDEDGLEVRGRWSRRFPLSRLTLEAGALSDDLLFGSASFSTRQNFGSTRIEESIRVDVDDEHYRGIAGASYASGAFRIGARYQIDRGTNVTLGGLSSSILPRSAYAHRILDPALPLAILRGRTYDGWRVETSVPWLPFTLFYQRHALDDARLSLAGGEVELNLDPYPILKLPGIDVTLGAAYVFDAPSGEDGVQGDTKFWLGMRWRP